MRIAILGVGLIGGSIGLAARDGAEVVGFDPCVASVDAALGRGAVGVAAESVGEAVREADVCFACAPVGVLPGLVEEALSAAPADCVVTDVGSTKRAITDAIGDERFIGGHPIAGSEASGVQAARRDLFDGATWYLTPTENSSGILYDRLHRLLAAFGAHPVAIAADDHDRLLATVSHLPHVLANVLVETAAMPAAALPRVGPSFRDLTRVAGANPAIWTDIYLSNAPAIADAIEQAAERLASVVETLRSGDRAAIDRWQRDARQERKRLLAADAAAGTATELRVVVPNRPGVLAELTLSLARGGVNIVDMALAPAPDNRTGAIRFWIAGDDSAARARGLLEELGFPVATEP